MPFIAITKAVFEGIASRQQQALQRSLDLHRELTRDVASERGLGAVAATWRRRTGTQLVILDRARRELAASTTSTTALLDRAQDLLDIVERRG
ncbi:MAG: PucR family transcriptional regulator, partial [Steroidobacteraceae bacterium]